nr:sulfur carrier protein ThiS [Granulicella arctica]
MTLQLNGNSRHFPELPADATLDLLVKELALQHDRVAVELNGEIIARVAWEQAALKDGDRLEVVHFVGGGCLSKV